MHNEERKLLFLTVLTMTIFLVSFWWLYKKNLAIFPQTSSQSYHSARVKSQLLQR